MKKEQSTIDKAQSEFKNAQIFVSKKAVKRLKAVMSSEGKSDHFLRMSVCLLYTSPSPRDGLLSRMPSSA